VVEFSHAAAVDTVIARQDSATRLPAKGRFLPPPSDTIEWYEANARQLAASYEALRAEDMHGWLTNLLPQPPAVAIDIGAGTGRDAAWLSSQGFTVIAVEPSAAMRAEGIRRHAESNILWIDDRLPPLAATLQLGIAADVVLLSAVLDAHRPDGSRTDLPEAGVAAQVGQHLGPDAATRPAESERRMHPSSPAQLALHSAACCTVAAPRPGC
jgi:SAM-dependent methyltransferase